MDGFSEISPEEALLIVRGRNFIHSRDFPLDTLDRGPDLVPVSLDGRWLYSFYYINTNRFRSPHNFIILSTVTISTASSEYLSFLYVEDDS